MCPKYYTLTAFIRSVRSLQVLSIRKDEHVAILSCFYHELAHIQHCLCLIVIFIIALCVPILNSSVSTSAIFLQRFVAQNSQRFYQIANSVHIFNDAIVEYGQISTLQSRRKVILKNIIHAIVHEAISTHPTISTIALSCYCLHELMQVFGVIGNSAIRVPLLVEPVEVDVPHSFIAQLPSDTVSGFNYANSQ